MSPAIDDSILLAAYSNIRSSHRASADDILVNPNLRCEFLKLVRNEVPGAEEGPVLKRLLNLRKRSRLPRGR